MIKKIFDSVKDQMGPCGIACGLCDLGNGTVAGSARKVGNYLQNYGVSQWASLLPGGSDVDFDQLLKSLDWVSTSIGCLGCEKGGGPPDCTIRKCASEKGHDICSECSGLKSCNNFGWLGDYGETLKEKLKDSEGRPKRELVEEAIAGIE